MRRFVLFFETYPLKLSGLKEFFKMEVILFNPYFCMRLINNDFKNHFEEEFNKLIWHCEILELYYYQIYFGKEFDIFAILFDYDGDLRQDILKERIPKIFEIIDNFHEIVRLDRYITPIYFNDEMIDIIEKSVYKKNNKSDLEMVKEFPFIIEIAKFTQFELNFNLIIQNYFNCNFPQLLKEFKYPDDALINNKFTIADIKELKDINNILENIHNIIYRELWDKIGLIYDGLAEVYLSAFSKGLDKSYIIYQTYGQKSLIKLKTYLNELKNSYYKYHNIFIKEFDKIGLELCRLNTTKQIYFKKNQLYKKTAIKYAGFFSIAETFLSIFFELKETIEENLNKIDKIILEKKDFIKTFSKSELTGLLETVKNEKIFRQKIIIPILKDLGFENIQELHGSYEYGIDILCSNKNKFGIIEWNAFVVKLGDINLKNGAETSRKLENIFNQSYQAKNIKHLDKNSGNIKIARVFISASGKINHPAKVALLNKHPLLEGNIFIIDREVLLNLF